MNEEEGSANKTIPPSTAHISSHWHARRRADGEVPMSLAARCRRLQEDRTSASCRRPPIASSSSDRHRSDLHPSSSSRRAFSGHGDRRRRFGAGQAAGLYMSPGRFPTASSAARRRDAPRVAARVAAVRAVSTTYRRRLISVLSERKKASGNTASPNARSGRGR